MTPTTSRGWSSKRMIFPIAPGSPPKRRGHSSWLRMTGTGGPPAGGGPGARNGSSSSVKSRPRKGAAPRTRKKLPRTPASRICSGSPPPVTETSGTLFEIAIESKSVARCRKSRMSGAAIGACGKLVLTIRFQIITRRSGSRYGSGRSSTASMTLKIAVVAPIPSARVRSATVVNPGLRRSVRTPYVMSCQSVVMAESSRWPLLSQSPLPSRRPQLLDDVGRQLERFHRLAGPPGDVRGRDRAGRDRGLSASHRELVAQRLPGRRGDADRDVELLLEAERALEVDRRRQPRPAGLLTHPGNRHPGRPP